MVDARLADGSRVNAIIPPLAIDGPALSIRKFAKEKLSIEDLIRFKAMMVSSGSGLSLGRAAYSLALEPVEPGSAVLVAEAERVMPSKNAVISGVMA